MWQTEADSVLYFRYYPDRVEYGDLAAGFLSPVAQHQSHPVYQIHSHGKQKEVDSAPYMIFHLYKSDCLQQK